ncbi:MAG: hypothetical protein QOF51_4096 [Chloroflexota bacterium]|nr:hypothetical protein [Chloroflexota bacterium]
MALRPRSFLIALLLSAVACSPQVSPTSTSTPFAGPSPAPRDTATPQFVAATPSVGGGAATPQPTAVREPPTTAPAAPTSVDAVNVAGTVDAVLASARVLLLQTADHGIDKVALSDATRIVDPSGAVVTLQAVTPGMQIEATGVPGEFGALIARRVQILRIENPPASSAGV